MDVFYLFVDEKYIYIMALNSETYCRPIFHDFPDYVNEHKEKLQSFRDLRDLQVELVKKITYNEVFQLHLNEDIKSHVNREIRRPEKKS